MVMKGTKEFKDTIQAYLENRAECDTLFARMYNKTNKNIDECITYILNAVKASGNNGFTDEEIFGMAVHYYDEDNIKPGSPIKCDVVVNHHVTSTEDELQQAREKAIKRIEDEAYVALKKKQERKRKDSDRESVQQLSLF